MSANSLLLWMSARRRGSWAQFRAAVEELHLHVDTEAEGEDDDEGTAGPDDRNFLLFCFMEPPGIVIRSGGGRWGRSRAGRLEDVFEERVGAAWVTRRAPE